MGGWVSIAPKLEQKDFRTQSTSIYPFLPSDFFKKKFHVLHSQNEAYTIQGHGIELENFNMGLLGPYQDVLNPKMF